MKDCRINLWKEDLGLYATIKNGAELCAHALNVIGNLEEEVKVNLGSLEYDDLYDWMDTCTDEELKDFRLHFSKKERQSKMFKIELALRKAKRNK
jgi:hypothetical protein